MQSSTASLIQDIIAAKDTGTTIDVPVNSHSLALLVNYVLFPSAQSEKSLGKILNDLNAKLGIRLHASDSIEWNFQLFSDIKPIKLPENKKGIILAGKGICVVKRTRKRGDTEPSETANARDSLHTDIIEATHRVLIAKDATLEEQDQTLLRYPIFDQTVWPLCCQSEVYHQFCAIGRTLLLLVPIKGSHKPDYLNFMRSSLLHVYSEYSWSMSRVMTKQILYKGSHLKGVYFLEQGEVEVRSKRIVARGWIVSGLSRATGYCWKFKPIPFIRCIIQDKNIWKQFSSDCDLNGDQPIQAGDLLGWSEDLSLNFKDNSSIRLKLPKISPRNNVAIDKDKLIQLERVRHYDSRLNDIFQYKKSLVNKKISTQNSQQFQPIVPQPSDRYASNSSLKRKVIRDKSPGQQSLQICHSRGVLVRSVLRRLQSIPDLSFGDESIELSHQISYTNRPKEPMKARKNRRITNHARD